jgi:hypothetical protein
MSTASADIPGGIDAAEIDSLVSAMDATDLPEATDATDLVTLADAAEEAGTTNVEESGAGAEGTGGAEVQAKEAEKTEEVKAEEVKQEAAPAEDPELTADENQRLRDLPEGEREAAAKEFKSARNFEQNFRSTRPMGEVTDYLQSVSAARYGELREHVITEALSDPHAWAADLSAKKPELYGKTALAVYEGSREFFKEQVLRDNPELKPGQAQPAASEVAPLVTETEEADIRAFFPERADEWIARLKEQRAAEAEGKPGEAAKATEAKAEGVKTEAKPEETKQGEEGKQADLTATAAPILDSTYKVVHEKLREHFNDPKVLGLEPTAAEWEKAPEVAEAKDKKADIFWYGDAGRGIPAFADGLVEWAKTQADAAEFNSVVQEWGYFAGHGEEKNAAETALKLVPFARRYGPERLNHPRFRQLDSLIRKVAAQADPPVETETHEPGTARTVSQQPSDPEKAFWDEVDNFGVEPQRR